MNAPDTLEPNIESILELNLKPTLESNLEPTLEPNLEPEPPPKLEPNWWMYPLTIFIASRLILAVIAFLAALALPETNTPDKYHYAPDNLWVDQWIRWDSTFFLEIAAQGYQVTLDEPSNVAFFPLYPILIRTLEPVFSSPLVAALFISQTGFLLSLLLLYRIASSLFDRRTAERAVLYLSIFPTSFYFGAVYTESLFLLLSLIAFDCARGRLWAFASLAVMLAAVTRPTGILLGLPLLLEWLASKPRRTLEFAWLLTIPLGLLSFMAFLTRAFNDPLAFWNTQSAFGRRNFDPSQPLAAIYRDLEPLLRVNLQTGPVAWNVVLDLGVLACVLILIPSIWHRLGVGWALYSLIAMMIPTASGTGSLARYVLVIFPALLVLARKGNDERLDRIILIVWPVLLGLLTVLFSRWVFVD